MFQVVLISLAYFRYTNDFGERALVISDEGPGNLRSRVILALPLNAPGLYDILQGRWVSTGFLLAAFASIGALLCLCGLRF